MKANELRIGNYYDHNGEVKQVTPNTIVEVCEAEREWCRAIPLNENWLKKFGFTFDERRLWSPSKSWHKYAFRPFGEGGIYDEFKQGSLGLQPAKGDSIVYSLIHYVHQLQNLHFALTGHELHYTQAGGV